MKGDQVDMHFDVLRMIFGDNKRSIFSLEYSKQADFVTDTQQDRLHRLSGYTANFLCEAELLRSRFRATG